MAQEPRRGRHPRPHRARRPLTPAASAAAGSDPIVPQRPPLDALPPEATAAQQYCFNTGRYSAADARFAWQAKKIKEMEARAREACGSARGQDRRNTRSGSARRDEFSKKAQEKLVAFYAKMRPDAAALHFSAMDDEFAAALLTKLEPKVASLVLAEIDPAKAAKIAAVISGAARIPRTAGLARPPRSRVSKARTNHHQERQRGNA